MFNIETQLAARYISKKEVKKITDPKVVIEEETGKVFITFKKETDKIRKDGTPIVRLYKNNITKSVLEHGGLQNFYKTLVASEMMLAGYMIIPVPNGWLCVGGAEIYSMKDQECTCPAYISNPGRPCKHLIYKEALLLQRSRINEWKKNNL